MGDKPDLSPEEAERIVKCFVDNFEDSEIQWELEDRGFERRGIRFIRTGRKYFNAAKRALREEIRKELREELEREFSPLLIKHYEELAEEAKKLRRELSVPVISWLRFRQVQVEGPVLASSPYGDKLWLLERVEGKPIVKLAVEDDNPFSLFGGVLEHLDAEFLDFSKRLERWRLEAGKLIGDCHRLSIEISEKLKGMKKGRPQVELGAGCSAAIYNWVLEHFGKEGQYPVVVKRVHGSRADLLVENEQGMWELASVPVEKTKQWERALHSLIDFYIKEQRAEKMISAADRLKEIADPLRDNLSLVINRRTFRGTCCICRGMRVS